MKTLRLIFRIITAIIFIIAQHALVIGLGILIYSTSGIYWGIVIWCLSIPMLWLNYWTWKYVMKYGVILFYTANRDTSEIDVKPENRPYRDG